jgi:hypothetical protein
VLAMNEAANFPPMGFNGCYYNDTPSSSSSSTSLQYIATCSSSTSRTNGRLHVFLGQPELFRVHTQTGHRDTDPGRTRESFLPMSFSSGLSLTDTPAISAEHYIEKHAVVAKMEEDGVCPCFCCPAAAAMLLLAYEIGATLLFSCRHSCTHQVSKYFGCCL